MRLLVEGWRFFPHSYSIINHFECLELLRRPEVQLFHRDLAPMFADWKPASGLLDRETCSQLAGIPTPDGAHFEAAYRLHYPFDFSPVASADRTCIFGTSEFGIVSPDMCIPQKSVRELHRDSDVIVITSSRWSRDGFIRAGAVPERVKVIPLGVDTRIYRPVSESERADLRCELGWDGFVFLNIGAMSPNKGLDLLLRGFAAVLECQPDALLVLKGLDGMYGSRQRVAKLIDGLSAEQQARVANRLIYLGDSMSSLDVARLYQAADAYVSPYLAEGFNMPVLEAIASGLPVICTAGGSTDDFVDEAFALRIASKVSPAAFVGHGVGKNLGFALKPDLDDLVRLMIAVIQNDAFRERAKATGPRFVGDRFTWTHVVDQLFEVLVPQSTLALAHA